MVGYFHSPERLHKKYLEAVGRASQRHLGFPEELEARRREVQELHDLLQTCLDYPIKDIHLLSGG